MKSEFLIIAGGGKFGLRAIDFAKKHEFITLIIDINPKCPASNLVDNIFNEFEEIIEEYKSLKKKKIYLLNQDISIINNILKDLNVEYIVPVVPIHLLALIMKNLLIEHSIKIRGNQAETKNFIQNANPDLLLSNDIEQGITCLSYANIDEKCPENCMGPFSFCPNFKREKPITITKYIKDYFNMSNILKIKENKITEVIIILESIQLMPGLGALKGKEVIEVIETIKRRISMLESTKFNLFIATTCNCHGIINFFTKKLN